MMGLCNTEINDLTGSPKDLFVLIATFTVNVPYYLEFFPESFAAFEPFVSLDMKHEDQC
jgi:hypothetical protein